MSEMKWTSINGINNVAEESDVIAARQMDDSYYLAYLAYGGVKVVEFSGITGICKMDDTTATEQKINDMTAGDWEVAIPVIIGERKVAITINDSDEFKAITEAASDVELPKLLSSEQYENEEWENVEDLYEECPFLEGLLDVLEII